MTCPRLFAWSAGTLQHSTRWRGQLFVVRVWSGECTSELSARAGGHLKSRGPIQPQPKTRQPRAAHMHSSTCSAAALPATHPKTTPALSTEVVVCRTAACSGRPNRPRKFNQQGQPLLESTAASSFKLSPAPPAGAVSFGNARAATNQRMHGQRQARREEEASASGAAFSRHQTGGKRTDRDEELVDIRGGLG